MSAEAIALGERIIQLLDQGAFNTNWVGYRLAEILPLEASIRQKLLEQEDSVQRLREIHSSIEIYFDKNSGE